MKNHKNSSVFGNTIETIVYTLLLIIFLWCVYLLELFYPKDFIRFGILPQDWYGLKGVIFSPLIHSPSDVKHLINNTFPATVLFASLIYFYREIAFKVFFLAWLFSGLFVWLFASNQGAYHIGFSSVIYALAGFIFTSGTLRKFRPLQGISLFVVFVYGSMIWGVLPLDQKVSWEGHLSGLFTGVILAFLFRNYGPQAPKYQFEIERELGIEPPDLEAIWRENVRLAEEERRIEVEQSKELEFLTGTTPKIVYEYKTNESKDEQ